MKKNTFFVGVSVIAAILCLSIGSTAYAEGVLSKEEKAKIRDEAVTKLNNTEWAIEIRSMDNPKKKPETDSVVFRKGKIESKMFAKDGYTGSNLTVNVEEDGHVMWETMQSATGKPPIFWRGEMQENGISGVISKQIDSGSSESYSFSAVQTGTVEPEPEKKVEEPVLAATEEVAQNAEAVVAEVQADAVVDAQQAVQEEAVAPVVEQVEPVKTTSKKKKKY